MGTVIIVDGDAYVVRDKGPEEALKDFLAHWSGDPSSLQLFQLVGEITESEFRMVSGPWVKP